MLSFARLEKHEQDHLLQDKSFNLFAERKKVADTFCLTKVKLLLQKVEDEMKLERNLILVYA